MRIKPLFLLAFALFHGFLYLIYSRTTIFSIVETGFERLKFQTADTDRSAKESGESFARLKKDSPEIEKILLVFYERNDLRDLEGFKSWRNKIAFQSAQYLGSGPKAVLLDFHIEDKGPLFAEDVWRLKRAFEKSGNIVLDYITSRSPENFFMESNLSRLESTAVGVELSDTVPRILTVDTNLDIPSATLLEAALDYGLANGPIWEMDREFRKMRLFSGFEGRLYEEIDLTLFRRERGLRRHDMNLSFARRELSIPKSDLRVPLDPYGQMRLDLRASGFRFRSLPFSELPKTDPSLFRDKVVIVGVGGGSINTDSHHTPAGIFQGPELIATGLYQFLSKRFFVEFSAATYWFATTFLCLALLLLRLAWGKMTRTLSVVSILGGLVAPVLLFERLIYLEQSYFLSAILLNHLLFLGNTVDKNHPTEKSSAQPVPPPVS